MSRTIAELAAKEPLRVAGLMSGTSADGVDAAIVDISRPAAGRERARPATLQVRLLAFQTCPYPPGVRRAVLALCRPATARVEDACRMNFVLGELFASAVIALARRAGIDPATIDLVGSHGQTICHLPRPGRGQTRCTLQIAECSVIAERTGITTVADFRPRDVAAGGQGAPLVPYADCVLFRHHRLTRAVQNIGGIANVTFLPPRARRRRDDADDVLAFDTGPGNMIMDRLAARVSGGRRRCDVGGRLAAKGRVHRPMLTQLMRHPFCRRRPPKSAGREEFGEQFADALYVRARGGGMSPADLLATVTAFTAASIADAHRRFLPAPADEVILCGGGARNPTLVADLRERLRPAAVRLSDELGISADAKEAVAFAVLAAETIRGVPANVPAATGATRPVVLGKIVPAGPRR